MNFLYRLCKVYRRGCFIVVCGLVRGFRIIFVLELRVSLVIRRRGDVFLNNKVMEIIIEEN